MLWLVEAGEDYHTDKIYMVCATPEDARKWLWDFVAKELSKTHNGWGRELPHYGWEIYPIAPGEHPKDTEGYYETWDPTPSHIAWSKTVYPYSGESS